MAKKPGLMARGAQRRLLAGRRPGQSQARRPNQPLLPIQDMPRQRAQSRWAKPLTGRQRAYEMQRRSWSRIPIIGSLIDLVRNIVYPREPFRSAKRMPLRQGVKSLGARREMLRVKMEMAQEGRRPSYQTVNEMAAHTVRAKGHQFARRGNVHGVRKMPERK